MEVQQLEDRYEDLVDDMIWNCQSSFGVDLRDAYRNGEEALEKALEKVIKVLKSRFKGLSPKEQAAAVATGLFDSQGNLIPLLNRLVETEDQDHSSAQSSLPDGANGFMIWAWDRATASKYRDARGKEIQVLVTKFTKDLQLIEKSVGQEVAQRMRELGIMAFLEAGKKSFNAARKNGGGILASIKAGVIAIGGFKVLALVVGALAIVTLVGTLFAKDAAGIALFVNDTDDSLQWDGYETWSGKITNIFVEKPQDENPDLVIPRRDKETSDDLVCGGLMSVQKKFFSLVGPHGAMGFKPTRRFEKGLKVGWDSPNTPGAKNKILVSANDSGSYTEFRKATYYKGSKQSISRTPNGKICGELYGTFSSVFSGVVYISES